MARPGCINQTIDQSITTRHASAFQDISSANAVQHGGLRRPRRPSMRMPSSCRCSSDVIVNRALVTAETDAAPAPPQSSCLPSSADAEHRLFRWPMLMIAHACSSATAPAHGMETPTRVKGHSDGRRHRCPCFLQLASRYILLIPVRHQAGLGTFAIASNAA